MYTFKYFMKACLSLIVIIATIMIVGCGGGGGGDGGGITPSIPYSGINKPAAITGENAETLAVGAFLIGQYAGQGGDVISLSSQGSGSVSTEVFPVNILALARTWEKTAISYLDKELTVEVVPLASVAESIPGYCGGYADIDGSVNENNGDFNLNVTYYDYSDDCVFTMSGRTNMKGRMSMDLALLYMTVNYEALALRGGGQNLKLSGYWSMDNREYPSRQTLDMVTQNEGTGKTYWARDYELYFSYVSGTSGQELEATGRYYDPDYGYVDLATLEPLRYHLEDDYPYQGVVKLTGESPTSALAEFVSNAVFRVSCDENGDGQYDDFDTGVVHWPGENNPPVAVALDPTTAGRYCTVILDGSTSYDDDTDPIVSYHWAVVSIPAGSQAVLSDPNSATPTLVPDIEGEYQFRLIVNDGIDDSVSWGLGCGVVNDDLACVSVDAFFGCPYEGLEVFDVGSDPEAVAIGDVNGDGLNDVVMTTGYYFDPDNDYKLFVFIQNGAGYLGTPIKYQTSGTYTNIGQSLAVGDLNADGKADVVVAYGDHIGLFKQNLAGALDSEITVSSDFCRLVRVGDVNDDGLDDVVGFGTDTIVILQNNLGGLDAPVHYPVNTAGSDIELGDVNGDALTDVIVMSGSGYVYDNIGILHQNMSGTLDSAVYYDLGGDELTDALGVGDLNGDGLKDVVVTVSGNYSIFYQNGSHTLDSAVSINGYGHAGPVDVADINDDGLDDIVSIQGGWQHLEIIRQQEGGILGPNELYLAPYYNITNPHGMAVGDIDNNGINDVVKAEAMYGLVVIYDSAYNH